MNHKQKINRQMRPILSGIKEWIEKEENPKWEKAWAEFKVEAKNLHTGRQYQGSNVFGIGVDMWINNYELPYYMTYNNVKYTKGAKFINYDATLLGIPALYWGTKCNGCNKELPSTFLTQGDRGNCECEIGTTTRPDIKVHTIYNVGLIEGVEIPSSEEFIQSDDVIIQAEDIVKNYINKPSIRHDGKGRAFYTPSEDRIRLPKKETFYTVGDYYSTLFHELVHSTGHKSRLNRELETINHFGDNVYAQEELVAEMGNAMLCAVSDIHSTAENSTAYVKNWLSTLENDMSILYKAITKAEKAVNYITNE